MSDRENFTVKLPSGNLFRCECGCNVFQKPAPASEPNRYRCNACGIHYIGEITSPEREAQP